MFWLIAAFLICLAALFIALPLLNTAEGAPEEEGTDVAFYRAQLEALDKDVARAVITLEEAKSAKVEISRRLLEADRRSQIGGKARGNSLSHPLIAAISFLFIAGLSGGIYMQLGAAGYDDQPLEGRYVAAEERHANRPSQAEAESVAPENPYQQNPEDVTLVDQLRTALASRPDDLRGHQLLVANEARLGRFGAAANAQQQVVRILGDAANAAEYADLADLMILAAGNYVSPEAEEVLHETLRLDPSNGTARFYMGMVSAQIGRADRAFQTWRELLEESAPEDPWMPAIRSQIMSAAQAAGVRYELPPEGTTPLRGPDQATVDAAAEMTPEQRSNMIEDMVSGLAARLAEGNGTAQEWGQLILAHTALGETQAAEAALDQARRELAEDAAALAILDQAEARMQSMPELNQ